MKSDYKVYSLQISDKFESYDEACRLLKNFYGILNRLITLPKFSNTSFIIGISDTSSKGAYVAYEKNGKKGRPKKVIIGDKLEYWHFHIYAISDTDRVASFCEEAKKRFNKKQKYKIGKEKNDSLENALNYLKKQSLNCWKNGNYFHSHF